MKCPVQGMLLGTCSPAALASHKHKFHLASVSSAGRMELPLLPQLPLNEQIQVLCVPVEKNQRMFTGLQVRAQLGPELEGQHEAAKLTPLQSTPG